MLVDLFQYLLVFQLVPENLGPSKQINKHKNLLKNKVEGALHLGI